MGFDCLCLFLPLLVTLAQGKLTLSPTPLAFIPGVSATLELQCALTPNSTEVNRVMVIQIEKLGPGGQLGPLVSMATGETPKLHAGPNRPESAMTAQGVISATVPTDSFLRLTLENPDDADIGVYVCVMSLLDTNYLLEQSQARVNVSIGVPTDNQTTQLIQMQLHELQHRVDLLANQLKHQQGTPTGSNSTKIAFTARPKSAQLFREGQALLFDDVDVNVGDCFNASSSFFDVTVTGSYVVMGAVSCDSGKTITELQVNGQSRAQLSTEGDDQSSVSMVMGLRAGDSVRLVGRYSSHNDTNVFADGDTVFSAFLI